MKINTGTLINFLGKSVTELTRDLARANRDLCWHQRELDKALRELSRGHGLEVIAKNHAYGVKIAQQQITKLTKELAKLK